MSSQRMTVTSALPSRVCGLLGCPNLIAGNDSHTACIACIGVAHACRALADPDTIGCDACESFSTKILRARCQAAVAQAGKPSDDGGGPVAVDHPAPRPRTPGLGGTSEASARFRTQLYIPPPPPFKASESGRSQCRFEGPGSLGMGVADGLGQLQPAYIPPPQAVVATVSSHLVQQHGEPLPSTPQDDEYSDEGLVDEDDEEEEDGEDYASPDGMEVSRDAPAAAVEPLTSPGSGLLPGLQSLMAPSEAGSAVAEAAGASSDASPEPAPAWAVLEQVVAKLGLQLTTEEREPAAPSTSKFLRMFPPPSRSSRVKKLPVAPGFLDALHSTWSTHAEPPKLGFSIETEGAVDLGFAGLPPMDPVLAHNISEHHKVSVTPKPCFPDPKDKAISVGVERAYRAAALTARTLNAATLCQGALSMILEELAPALGGRAAEVDRLVQLIIRLNCHATEWTGKTMDTCAAIERARWLELVRFTPDAPKEAKKHVLGLPLAPGNLFEGASEYLKNFSQSKEATRKAAEGMLAPAPPPPSRHRGERSGDRGRAPSRQRPSRPSSTAPAAARERSREEGGGRAGSIRSPTRGSATPPPPPNKRRDTGRARRGGRGK